MSENSSDSDSSCGWTVINHEGSDIETVASENGSTNDNHEFVSEEYVSLQEEEQAIDVQAQCNNDEEIPAVDNTLSGFEETQTVPEENKEKVPDDGSCIGTISDDSDIVTLEAPKPEETQSQEEAPADGEEAQSSEDFNMGSSSSSQYAFSHVETGKSNRVLSNCVQKCHQGKNQIQSLVREPSFYGERKKIMVLLSTCPSIRVFLNSRCPLQFCLNVCLQFFN